MVTMNACHGFWYGCGCRLWCVTTWTMWSWWCGPWNDIWRVPGRSHIWVQLGKAVVKSIWEFMGDPCCDNVNIRRIFWFHRCFRRRGRFAAGKVLEKQNLYKIEVKGNMHTWMNYGSDIVFFFLYRSWRWFLSCAEHVLGQFFLHQQSKYWIHEPRDKQNWYRCWIQFFFVDLRFCHWQNVNVL